MVRIVGVDLPEQKPILIALTSIFGVGRRNARQILQEAKIEQSKRPSELSNEEVSRMAKVLEGRKIEGELRREINENIKRLKEIGTYRGLRHARNLPVRGQRTRTNARTKRGKRVTIGALKKEALSRTAPKATAVKGA